MLVNNYQNVYNTYVNIGWFGVGDECGQYNSNQRDYSVC